MSQYEDDADLLSEECANCGELRGACDCVEPAESDRIDLKQVANMLYDLFRSAPIPATINGDGGRAAFYDRDAQRAQALIILTKIWQAARATPSPEPPKCGSKSHHSEEVCCLESGHTDRHQSENGAKWFDTWEEENSGHRRPHLSESCPKREMAILEESALAMAQSTIQNAMRDANVSNLDSSMLSGNCDLTIRTMARALAACGLEIRFNAVPLSGPPEPPRETEITNHHDMEWALEQRPSSHSPDPTRQALCRKCSKPQSDSVHKRPIFKGGHYFHPPDENFAPSSHSEPELVKLREALQPVANIITSNIPTWYDWDEDSGKFGVLLTKRQMQAILAALASTPHMHEDELPANMPKKDYHEWYLKSWIPDGGGCRVGPIYPAEK